MTNPRTSMDPEIAELSRPVPTSKDPSQNDIFADVHPENIPDELEPPKVTEPSDSEGAEAGGKVIDLMVALKDSLGREASRR